jgi:hypothetical protein
MAVPRKGMKIKLIKMVRLYAFLSIKPFRRVIAHGGKCQSVVETLHATSLRVMHHSKCINLPDVFVEGALTLSAKNDLLLKSVVNLLETGNGGFRVLNDCRTWVLFHNNSFYCE